MEYYANQNFDDAQRIALYLAHVARQGGRAEPQYGYSDEDWAAAKMIVQSGITSIAGMDSDWDSKNE